MLTCLYSVGQTHHSQWKHLCCASCECALLCSCRLYNYARTDADHHHTAVLWCRGDKAGLFPRPLLSVNHYTELLVASGRSAHFRRARVAEGAEEGNGERCRADKVCVCVYRVAEKKMWSLHQAEGVMLHANTHTHDTWRDECVRQHLSSEIKDSYSSIHPLRDRAAGREHD